jgi:hypothetical protein
MKHSNLLFTIFFIIVFGSCKKSAVQGPAAVPFAATEYKYIGKVDTLGRPENLLKRDTLTKELTQYIDSLLPEGKSITKTSLLSSNSDLNITQKSEVYITFVTEGAGQLNTLGYYTYPTSAPPKKATDISKIVYMFPNASLDGWFGGGLQQGDKISIGTFEPGTSIGFVLLEGGWNSTKKEVSTTVNHFCSNEVLNPESDPNLKKHTVLLNYTKENKILIGFEDQIRTDPSCDNDFNDVIIYATIKPGS